jgi:hypothetical protein
VGWFSVSLPPPRVRDELLVLNFLALFSASCLRRDLGLSGDMNISSMSSFLFLSLFLFLFSGELWLVSVVGVTGCDRACADELMSASARDAATSMRSCSSCCAIRSASSG